MTFLVWLLLLILCWPLALAALVLYPIVWLLALPFRLVGITLEGVFACSPRSSSSGPRARRTARRAKPLTPRAASASIQPVGLQPFRAARRMPRWW